MEFAELVHARRTHKEFGPEPVPRETIVELLDLARLAPNHHLTQPWRFRVLGPETLARLREAAGPKEAAKLERAPTLVVVSAALTGELVQDEEDLCATAAALTIVLLAATERGLASYWRTPGVLRTRAGREAVGVPDGERVLALLHLGAPAREPSPREREPVDAVVAFLP
ncbi:MAG TPA: nitroreductase family protein [Gaiellaceae bacterium]|nr:nitroreductase family protein [Gaiellaceae bacterium]